MKKSTNLTRTTSNEPIEPTTTGLGQATTGFNFGSGSSFGSNSFDFGFGSGGGFDFGFDQGGFNFGSGGGFNFGSSPLGGNFSFGSVSPTNFDATTLGSSAFGPNSPFASRSAPLRQGEPTQSKVPQIDDWKEFVGFLFANGPKWVRAFQDGRIRAPAGASGPTGDTTQAQRRAMLYRAIQERRNNNSLIPSGGNTGTLLLVGGLALGGVLLAIAMSGGGQTVVRRPAPSEGSSS